MQVQNHINCPIRSAHLSVQTSPLNPPSHLQAQSLPGDIISPCAHVVGNHLSIEPHRPDKMWLRSGGVASRGKGRTAQSSSVPPLRIIHLSTIPSAANFQPKLKAGVWTPHIPNLLTAGQSILEACSTLHLFPAAFPTAPLGQLPAELS